MCAVAKPLVIVESPAKARTIEGFLGGEFTVLASMGHIRDLPAKGLSVDVENDFKVDYEVHASKKDTIAQLKRALKDADQLYLATDEDREGEAISWHLLEVLRPTVPVKRMVFHEITRSAIEHAIEEGRDVDYGLVDAQESRRIVDRLYGYPVSEVCWRKIRQGLSAGRVQSPSVRLVVERERERMAFVAAGYWDLAAAFPSDPAFTAQLATVDGSRVAGSRDFDSGGQTRRDDVAVLDEVSAQQLKDGLVDQPFTVTSVETRPYTSRPKPPFITSTLQQVGGSRLRMSSRQVMSLAQGLYEDGYITYMRTDSTTLSTTAIDAARQVIERQFGREYLTDQPRTYAKKSKNAQEAHEAIRPAGDTWRSPDEIRSELRGDQLRLYELIWQRTLASQMPDAAGQHGDGSHRRHHGRRCRHRVERLRSHDHVPRMAGRLRVRRRRRCRRDRRRQRQAAAAERRPTPPQPRRRGGRAHHPTAAALHRGNPGEDPRGEGHRSPVHLRVDHADDPRPWLRVEEGAGPRPHHGRVRGRRAARAALQPPGRLRVHRSHGGRPRRDRRWPPAAGSVAPPVLVRQRNAGCEGPEGQRARGGRRRGDQHDPSRRGHQRRGDRHPQRPLRAVPQAWR